MKVEIVSIAEFAYDVSLMPGDTLKCFHEYDLGLFDRQRAELCRQNITEYVTWTHSILFKLNGVLKHIIGDQATVAWVEGLVSECA